MTIEQQVAPNDAATAAEAMDPVTFEVIRHRLWAINDDQATMAARLSGSPVVYEALDFNAAILTPTGHGLYAGIFILMHATSIDIFVQRVLRQWSLEDIHDGDMFFTNDPWSGALHANDGILAAPIFWRDELVAWAGIVMHDNDVGSPVPGSFVVGASDRFGEAPLWPPIKLVTDYELRPDLEAAYLYNHRTPELNALNLRARLASLKVTGERVRDLIDRYGIESFRTVRDGIIDYTERIARSRLLEIPDGTWSDQIYLDHDGNQNEIYPIRCQVTKRADHLTVDFTGTAKQAVGSINCAGPAMEATVIGVFFIFLGHDLPWSVGAARRLLNIVSEPGTVNNAVSPAGVSMASVMATLSTQDAVSNAFAKMLLGSDAHRGEAQACWAAGHNLLVVAGLDRHGEGFALPLLDACGGGGGARTFRDGINSAGPVHSMSATIPNVETSESRAPFLEIFRRESQDSAGPGRFRGGVGIEFGLLPHRNPIDLTDVIIASGVSQPEAHGLAGGGPAAVKSNVILRGTNIREQFAAGRLPTSEAELEAQTREVLQAKAHTVLGSTDVHISTVAGGGGYGDPLRREPEALASDVAQGLTSEAIAATVYGMVRNDDGEIDAVATERARERIRATRLQVGRPVDPSFEPAQLDDVTVLHAVSDTLELVSVGDDRAVRCTVCHRCVARAGDDYKRGTVMRELPITATSPLNELGDTELFLLREFSCGGCGTAVAVDVQRTGEPLLDEGHFG